MKKHWAFPGVVGSLETSLPRSRNLSRDEESCNGTSHRDAVAFFYPKVKKLAADGNYPALQKLLLAAMARLVTEELHRRRKFEYRTMTARMRMELAVREGALRPDIFLSVEQLYSPIASAADASHHLAVFSCFLRSIQVSELHFEPFLSQLAADPALTDLSVEVQFLNRDFNAVLA